MDGERGARVSIQSENGAPPRMRPPSPYHSPLYRVLPMGAGPPPIPLHPPPCPGEVRGLGRM